MTDLEMTRLCAEAMGYRITDEYDDLGHVECEQCGDFDPIHDDAQAMALVKNHYLAFYWRFNIVTEPRWEVCGPEGQKICFSKDLNRAIVECVAKMQKAQAA